MRVGGLHRVEAGERRDQHEQRRARQMEVGQHRVDGAKPIARRDEDGRSRPRRDGSCRTHLRRSRCRRNDVEPTATMRPPARRASFNARRDGLADDAVFGVHAVLFDGVGLHRQERARADMQRDRVQADAARLQPRHELVGEMQTRGRRRDRAFVVREQRLVVGAVVVVRRAARRDVGRQRHVAALGDRLVEHRTVEREREGDLAALALRLDARIELAEKADLALVAEAHGIADGEPLRRLHERAPARAVEAFDEIRLDRRFRAASDAPPMQARRDHPRVVDDELVAGAQQLRQVAHDAILERRAGPHDKQPRRIARPRRAQRDPLRRQVEIEQVGAHAPSSFRARRSMQWRDADPESHKPQRFWRSRSLRS